MPLIPADPIYICRLRRPDPGASNALRDEICGLRGINWDSWAARLAMWLLKNVA